MIVCILCNMSGIYCRTSLESERFITCDEVH